MIKKASLVPLLRMVGTLDNSACPYVSVQVPPGNPPRFYRSSSFSFVQSRDFDPVETRHFVSFGHLQDCLRASADSLEFSADDGGIVCIESVDGPYRNFMHVHTVRERSTGVKYHSVGEPVKERLDASAFSGIDVTPFPVASTSLDGGKLVIGTQAGLVKWKVPESLGHISSGPRKSFLDFVCGSPADFLSISGNGYWIAHKGGMVGVFSSHGFLDPLRQVFDVPGVEAARLDAVRLVQAFRSVLVLCEGTDRVEIGPERGVSCRDKYGNEAVFSLGECPPSWAKFGITGQTAKLLADALAQSGDKEASLLSTAPKAGLPAMRMSRGLFEVDFRVLP